MVDHRRLNRTSCAEHTGRRSNKVMDELLNEMKQRGLATSIQIAYLKNITANMLLKALVACEVVDYYTPLEKVEHRVGKLFEFSPNLDHKVTWANPLRTPFVFSRN